MPRIYRPRTEWPVRRNVSRRMCFDESGRSGMKHSQFLPLIRPLQRFDLTFISISSASSSIRSESSSKTSCTRDDHSWSWGILLGNSSGSSYVGRSCSSSCVRSCHRANQTFRRAFAALMMADHCALSAFCLFTKFSSKSISKGRRWTHRLINSVVVA
jgi:hypothetical protein